MIWSSWNFYIAANRWFHYSALALTQRQQILFLFRLHAFVVEGPDHSCGSQIRSFSCSIIYCWKHFIGVLNKLHMRMKRKQILLFLLESHWLYVSILVIYYGEHFIGVLYLRHWDIRKQIYSFSNRIGDSLAVRRCRSSLEGPAIPAAARHVYFHGSVFNFSQVCLCKRKITPNNATDKREVEKRTQNFTWHHLQHLTADTYSMTKRLYPFLISCKILPHLH